MGETLTDPVEQRRQLRYRLAFLGATRGTLEKASVERSRQDDHVNDLLEQMVGEVIIVKGMTASVKYVAYPSDIPKVEDFGPGRYTIGISRSKTLHNSEMRRVRDLTPLDDPEVEYVSAVVDTLVLATDEEIEAVTASRLPLTEHTS